MANGADLSILNFLYGTDLFKDFKVKKGLIPPAVLGVTKMGDIYVPQAHVLCE